MTCGPGSTTNCVGAYCSTGTIYWLGYGATYCISWFLVIIERKSFFFFFVLLLFVARIFFYNRADNNFFFFFFSNICPQMQFYSNHFFVHSHMHPSTDLSSPSAVVAEI